MLNVKDKWDITKACNKLKVSCEWVDVIPFSNQLPAFKLGSRNIYYGTTSFIELLRLDDGVTHGVWLDPEKYTTKHYIKHWKAHMLNSEAQIMRFSDLMERRDEASRPLFIRPNADNKAFAGTVMTYGEIEQWYHRVKDLSNGKLDPNTEVVVGEPYRINYEWRLWMVAGKVIAASQYRRDFRLSTASGCPEAVKQFAEDRCLEYLLDDVFVMDVCETGRELYILECGSINSAGFYKANIYNIVSSVSQWVAQSAC